MQIKNKNQAHNFLIDKKYDIRTKARMIIEAYYYDYGGVFSPSKLCNMLGVPYMLKNNKIMDKYFVGHYGNLVKRFREHFGHNFYEQIERERNEMLGK